MNSLSLLSSFFYYYYFHLVIYLKGFRIYEDHTAITQPASSTYHFTLDNGKVINFTLYRVPQVNTYFRFGFFRTKTIVNLFLKIEVEDGLPSHLLRHNRMKLQSISFYIPKREEPLFLQILVDQYMNYVQKTRQL